MAGRSISPSRVMNKCHSWDRALSHPEPDYTSLYYDMTAMAQNQKANNSNLDLWWRLSKVTFQLGLNSYRDVLENETAARARFEEALKYAKQAILCNPRSFQANLAKGRAIDRLDTMNPFFDPAAIEQLYFAVMLCADVAPKDSEVAYLDSVVKFAVWSANRDEPEQLGPYPALRALLPVNLASVEQSLMQSQKTGLHYFDQYSLLIKVRVALKKPAQAQEAIQQCLAYPWRTNYERLAAKKLQSLQSMVVPAIEEALNESEDE